MFIDPFMHVFAERGGNTAIIWRDRLTRYGCLYQNVLHWLDELRCSAAIPVGSVVALNADYSPTALALFLALIEHRCIVLPLTQAFRQQRDEFYATAEVQAEVTIDDAGHVLFVPCGGAVSHTLTRDLLAAGRPGVLIFSSGSTGRSKAVLHDGVRLLAKFRTPRKARRTIPFMLLDHIGGINTALHVLSSGGTLVLVDERSPEAVCRAIEQHRVQILPTSPTFLNLLLLRGCESSHDLSSLETIAYGAEPMPDATLQRLHAALPTVQLVQNYGISEIGVMHTHSEAPDSTWVRLGGDGYQTRVRDGMLEIRADSAMLGYLNAPSPFTEDGWFITGDMVEVKGDYMRVLGRRSEIINVGGEKVYPAEVEGEVAQMPGVVDVVVTGEPHALVGHIVKATVRLDTDENSATFRRRMVEFLADRLPTYKVPRKIVLTREALHGERFKKLRARFC